MSLAIESKMRNVFQHKYIASQASLIHFLLNIFGVSFVKGIGTQVYIFKTRCTVKPRKILENFHFK